MKTPGSIPNPEAKHVQAPLVLSSGRRRESGVLLFALAHRLSFYSTQLTSHFVATIHVVSISHYKLATVPTMTERPIEPTETTLQRSGKQHEPTPYTSRLDTMFCVLLLSFVVCHLVLWVNFIKCSINSPCSTGTR